ncbi:uncharacterized protein BO95DRAFT_185074 [Aspergillus brunneoviolaceus CBS 621.78]|uniref:Uncharacterized protein n=1 Tax=Aspergillus brunneoviolaceus CBS 621.78 TaxID=1450534 RepID=A0ACD1G4N5_9EURO|nr:hypothetical protein BO95DRAFT_185074 [Aspergillus brunneoviolaceus CBS 621.78]RAH44119.1 hypothetical protein BO95DRAFT_185074 [Aspergillus brunneoviolaceus CBS 621.78]
MRPRFAAAFIPLSTLEPASCISHRNQQPKQPESSVNHRAVRCLYPILSLLSCFNLLFLLVSFAFNPSFIILPPHSLCAAFCFPSLSLVSFFPSFQSNSGG